MTGLMDWFLEKMKLVEDENGEPEAESKSPEPSRLSVMKGRKAEEPVCKRQLFFKNLMTYDDAKAVIDNYKSGAACIIYINPDTNHDDQGMLRYICGGIYALEGEVIDSGGNVFVVERCEGGDY